ncbi:ABC transporter permease [Bradyrhizobium sp. RT11b]|uniref:ABC transporter permease n=1 Tax=Bradyrhizobium sp. RT11b TaxID=3156332 RepID=UPI003398F6BE
MNESRWQIWPPLLVYMLLVVLPLVLVVDESFKEYAAGTAGGSRAGGGYTFQNYRSFLDPAYLGYVKDTFFLSLIACALAIFCAYPIAYWLAHTNWARARKLVLIALMLALYVSVLVKVYGIALALGSVGWRPLIASVLGLGQGNRTITALVVVIGLLNFLIPIAILMLVAPFQNIDPSLLMASQSLGATRVATHISVVLPLAAVGMVQTFVLIYCLAISAFVIPWILGRGQIIFLSNLIYARFSEISNFPSGSALSVLLLAASLATVFLLTKAAGRVFDPRLRAAP